ncbi:hydroxylase [Pseudomonas phage Misse]|nr:hydroxylase [Pseudomonas phage Misse]
MLLLRKASTAIPAVQKLHPELVTVLEDIKDQAERVELYGASSLMGVSPALARIAQFVTHHGAGVYSIPYLNPHYCHELRGVFSRGGYTVNPQEPEPAQIPEIVLEHACKPLFDCLSVLWAQAAAPLARILWNMDPDIVGSIQAAEYDSHRHRETAWHLDAESDVTLVVNLGSDFKGGGTELAPGFGFANITVPPLPSGHGLFFKGRSTLHRGLAVEEGTRTLLVHWTQLNS